jgi:hypothetical protein
MVTTTSSSAIRSSLVRSQLADHHLEQHLLRGQDLLEPGDELLHLGQLVQDLLPLQAGEALELHLEDGLGLDLGEGEPLHHLVPGGVAVRGLLDELDDLVDVVERDLVAEQDVLALARLAQLVAGPPGDHVPPVGDEPLQHLLERQDARLAAVDGQHDDAEAGLELGVGVEVVEHHLAHRIALQLDDDAHALARGLVAQVADPLQPLVPHQLGDVLHQLGLVDLVRDLVDDDGLALGLGVDLDAGPRPDLDGAAPGLVGGPDPVAPQDAPCGGEVGAGDVLHQLGHRQLRVGDEVDGGVDHLAHVVGRDVGGHADGDAGGAVDQQIREAGGEDLRLERRVVEVGRPVDRLLVDVGEEEVGEPRHARLGVPVGGGRVAVDGAEVALAVDQRVAEVPVLGQADQRVVDRGVAVRVVLLQHLADHAGALGVLAVVEQALGLHRVEDPAMHRLQPVAHVRQRAADDHRHRVVEVRLAELGLDVHLRPVPVARGGSGGFGGRRREGLVWHSKGRSRAWCGGPWERPHEGG